MAVRADAAPPRSPSSPSSPSSPPSSAFGAAPPAQTTAGRRPGTAQPQPRPQNRTQRAALRDSIPQRASAASSVLRASTQRSPSGVVSFFQNGASVFR